MIQRQAMTLAKNKSTRTRISSRDKMICVIRNTGRISFKKRISIRFMKWRNKEIRENDRYYHPLEDDEIVDATIAFANKSAHRKEDEDLNIDLTKYDTNNNDDILRNKSHLRTQKPDNDEITSVQISIINHLQNKNKISLFDTKVDCTILPHFVDDEIASKNTSTLLTNENCNDFYDNLDSSFVDDNMKEINKSLALDTITEEPMKVEVSWMEPPSLIESESDEESVADEDHIIGERSLLNIEHIPTDTENALSHDQRACATEFTSPPLPLNEHLPLHIRISSDLANNRREALILKQKARAMKISSTLAYNRKEALLRKRKSHAQTRGRIRISIRVIIATCVVLITIHAYYMILEVLNTGQPELPAASISHLKNYHDERISHHFAQSRIIPTNNTILDVCPIYSLI